MNILYLGVSSPDSTSRHRANALQRLGHKVTIIDPYPVAGLVNGNRYHAFFHQRTGYRFLQARMLRWLKSLNLTEETVEVVWVNGGELFGLDCVRWLKGLSRPVILYNNDDPTGNRDGRRFDLLRRAIPFYDLCVAMREINVAEFTALGAKKVVRVMMGYDEVAHAPPDLTAEAIGRYGSDVCFIGTWMPERGPFLARLLERGVPLSIWGDRWSKAPEWDALKTAWRGPGLQVKEYGLAIAASKVAIGLLSKGNRDFHTTRTFEIPSLGGLFCAERTSEHEGLFREGQEAVYWNDAEECAEKCLGLLADPKRREIIRLAGQRRLKELKRGNEDNGRRILAAVGL